MERPGDKLTRSLLVVIAGLVWGCSGSEKSLEFQAERAASAAEQLVARPQARLLLTDSVLQRLQQRAAAGDAAWQALQSRCDG